MAFYELEPFGEERADYRIAIMTATFANIHGRKKGRRAFKPSDFMPKFGKETLDDRRQSAAEIENTLQGYAIAHNRARENRMKRLGPKRTREIKAREKEKRSGQYSNISRSINAPDSRLRERDVESPTERLKL